MEVGVDSGGTFTDVVADDGRVHKVLSTPDDPGRAVRAGVAALHEGRPSVLAHGTTVATNAVLEGKGAPVALVTSAGFADVIEIGRQDRPRLFDHWADRPPALVPRERRVEVAERLAGDGTVLVPVDPDALPPMPDGTEAVAVCLLHSIVAGDHEAAITRRLMEEGWDVSASSTVAPEFREWERTVTTVLNATLRPRTRAYLEGIADAAAAVFVMTSAGGLVPLALGAELPVQLLLSGPAAGVAAAAAVAAAHGFDDALTFDMGGTSTDVCAVSGGRPEPAGQRHVAGYPVRVPSLDIHTIGAGGGSVAWLDAGAALRVGPRSAGAAPGPACYGLGGTAPTVTDADLVAGRIPPEATFGDLGRLDLAAARAALDGLGVAATDVLAVVDAEMAQALRVVSVERGLDPRGMALVAFGGAGPLHAAALADQLDMAAVIVPARAGVLSAVGLLGAPVVRELVVAWPGGTDHHGLDAAMSELAGRAVAELAEVAGSEGVGNVQVTTELDARYDGQSQELRVGRPEEFDAEHRRRNGYDRAGDAVEVVALRARAWVDRDVGIAAGPPVVEGEVVGPEVVATADSTVWVPDGWVARPGVDGAAVLERRPAR